MLGVSTALLVLLVSVRRIGRSMGLIMLAVYAVYTAFLYIKGDDGKLLPIIFWPNIGVA